MTFTTVSYQGRRIPITRARALGLVIDERGYATDPSELAQKPSAFTSDMLRPARVASEPVPPALLQSAPTVPGVTEAPRPKTRRPRAPLVPRNIDPATGDEVKLDADGNEIARIPAEPPAAAKERDEPAPTPQGSPIDVLESVIAQAAGLEDAPDGPAVDDEDDTPANGDALLAALMGDD